MPIIKKPLWALYEKSSDGCKNVEPFAFYDPGVKRFLNNETPAGMITNILAHKYYRNEDIAADEQICALIEIPECKRAFDMIVEKFYPKFNVNDRCVYLRSNNKGSKHPVQCIIVEVIRAGVTCGSSGKSEYHIKYKLRENDTGEVITVFEKAILPISELEEINATKDFLHRLKTELKNAKLGEFTIYHNGKAYHVNKSVN